MICQYASNPLLLLVNVIAVAVCISIHEYAHARAAYSAGDATAKAAGRMTLNPIAHYDVVGTTMLLLFGFGWAKPVPVRPGNFRNPARHNVTVSLWGPLSNILLAIPCGLALRLALARTIPVPPNLMLLLVQLTWFNLVLALFNLIPLPPLDGSHVLRGILPSRAGYAYAVWASRYGMALLIALIIIPRFLRVLDPLAFILWKPIALVFQLITSGLPLQV